MIRIRRLPLSAGDAAGLAAWQQQIKGCRRGGRIILSGWKEFNGTPLRDRIEDRLNEQSLRKCVYCEHHWPSKIDHFYPKLRYPRRTFERTNFNWACSDCNFFKGPHLKIGGGRPVLLNPMEEDRRPHLSRPQDRIHHSRPRAGSARGQPGHVHHRKAKT